MPKLPLLTAREISKVLKKLGFVFKRQEGSHMFFEHADGRTTVVPNHAGEEIDTGLLNKIIKHDLKISREEFLRYL
ncbi:MAG: type II toxin-antitoxin system HicA family toxin [Candidatus Diapherotrites archaeon]|nr:type II toxin-antitoxin system HicA family toxin [Candidatus Diapherotrites archaeon]